MSRPLSEFLQASSDKPATETPNADFVRRLGELGLTVEQIVPLMEVVERELLRRRLARASKNTATGSFDELERILRKPHAHLSARIGDERKARRIILDGLPLRERRIFAAMLAQKRGRPSGDAGLVARKNEAWLNLYKLKTVLDPMMGPWKFARWLHEEKAHGASVEANYKKLKSLLQK
jgi:hypothetical protein